MSYQYRNHRNGRQAMGDITGAINTVVDVAGDPYLTEVLCRINQLKAIDHAQPVPVCANTPPGSTSGVGLRNAIPVLRAYVYAQQHPWVYAAAVAGLVGLPMLIGYRLGQSSGDGQ